VEKDDREDESYGAEEDMNRLHLEARGFEVADSALLLAETALLHTLHLCEVVVKLL
jgi:hypothetical protein